MQTFGYHIMARRKKVLPLLLLSFGFTFAVLHHVFEFNELELTQKFIITDEGLNTNNSDPNPSDETEVEDGKNEIFQSTRSIQEGNVSYSELIYHPNPRPVWTYRCHEQVGCLRELRGEESNDVVEPEVCWLNCGPYGALWPYPTGKTVLGRCLVPFYHKRVKISSSTPDVESQQMLQKMQDIFLDRLQKTIPEDEVKNFIQKQAEPTESIRNEIVIKISVVNKDIKIVLGTDETYSISIVSNETKCKNGEPQELLVEIKAETIFGARHALQSLSQLMTYDRQKTLFRVVGNAKVQDAPAFPYRGLLIDTARTFIPISDLKRTLDAMSYNKLNIFHWHITDSNSFPFFSKLVPEMTQYGAYSNSKIYYPEDVRDLIQYARLRSIKVVVELDAPAHAGNGWQWGPSKGLGNLALCVNAEPWRSFCGQFLIFHEPEKPPCGQLNINNINVYIILEKIYQDMLEEFDSDLFHMGGDEVSKQCWLSDPAIAQWMKEGQKWNYMKVWGFFQEEAYKRLKKANEGKPVRPIVWTSAMTSSPSGRKFLNSSDYIIQVWENGKSPVIKTLVEENYQLIISNNDVMYLDQGAGSWLGKDHIYEYKQWQVMYDNHLNKFLPNITEDKKKDILKRQILGGECTLWSEKVNSQNMDAKTWPRAAAVAENLWSDPVSRPPSVYSRLNHHTNKMIQLGIRADQLQPESCYQLTGHCQDHQKPI